MTFSLEDDEQLALAIQASLYDEIHEQGSSRSGAIRNSSRKRRQQSNRLESFSMEYTKEPCSICLDPFGKKVIKPIQCGHIFHTACIDRWYKINPKCPICK